MMQGSANDQTTFLRILTGYLDDTILHYFVRLNDPVRLEHSILLGANVQLRNKQGLTPMDLIVFEGPYVSYKRLMCKALIRGGADVLTDYSDHPDDIVQRVLNKFRRRFAACKLTQSAFIRVFRHHCPNVLVPDMMRVIGAMIWSTRTTFKW
jgi:hypothetical protein